MGRDEEEEEAVLEQELEQEDEDEKDKGGTLFAADMEEDPGDALIEEDESAKKVAQREKQRLAQQKRKQQEMLNKLRDEQNKQIEGDAEKQKQVRMNFLLAQTEIFAHFLQGGTGTTSGKRAKGRSANKAKEEEEDREMQQGAESEQGVRLTTQPECIKGGSMRDYQLAGLNWLLRLYDNGVNGILADEMGLGKTLQTIALLGYLAEYRGIKGPHMVVVPKSTLPNWLNEFNQWCPQLNVFKFHGNAQERQEQKEKNLQPGKFNVMVTTYEMVIKEKAAFKPWVWRYIIIDEAHRIKNVNSALSKVMRQFRSTNRLLLTGTPLQNNLNELWALLNFLLPEVFHSSEQFQEWFSSAEGGDNQQEHVVKQLHKVLRPFLLRRLKSEVERGLPAKKETVLKVGMSKMQKDYYKHLLQRDFEAVNKGAERSRLLNIVMQLRKCCNHPYLFQGAEPGPPFITGEHLVQNSGKMVLLDKLLPKLKERGSRVLIFSQMTRLLDILEDYLLYRGHKYCRIDGNTMGEDRENMIDSFNDPESEKFVFLLSTRAGGLGINLAAADTVLLYDSDWNPQMDLQAIDRAHRIGQKNTVQVFRFCTENSVEEKVIQKAYKKLQLDALVIQQGRMQETNKTVNKDDLLSMVRYGAEKIFQSSDSTITDEDVDAIIAKGEAETRELNEKMKEFSEKAIQFSLQGDQSLYDFDTKDEEDQEKEKVDNIKQAAVNNWESGERVKKRGGDFATQRQSKQQGPPKSKLPALQDFQFFNIPRIQELYEKEDARNYYEWQRKEQAKQLSEGEELPPEPEDAPKPLTEEEQEERSRLLSEGFHNWTRRDFQLFCKACEKYGRENLEQIAKDIDTKSFDEVKAYADTFFKRYKELKDGQKIMDNIEKGEQKIRRQQEQVQAIRRKINQYKDPWREMRIHYGQNKGKSYTEEEDRFLLCAVDKAGFGNWEDLKAEIRKSWLFRFDWYFKSRTPQELAKRVETLVKLVEREMDDTEEGGGGASGRGKRKAGGGDSGGGSKKAKR